MAARRTPSTSPVDRRASPVRPLVLPVEGTRPGCTAASLLGKNPDGCFAAEVFYHATNLAQRGGGRAGVGPGGSGPGRGQASWRPCLPRNARPPLQPRLLLL